jgi:hypothetical protein
MLFFCCSAEAFCQKGGLKKGGIEKQYKVCRNYFLKQQISHTKYYSNDIILPVTIANDKYRIKIKSEYLHKYLTVMAAKNEKEMDLDSTLLDSTVYMNKVLNILSGTEKLDFSIEMYDMFVKGEKYVVLDKLNPYTIEIKKVGLNTFISKRFYKNTARRGNNITYLLVYKDDYSKINEYGLNYLNEALFDYNFRFESGDGTLGFTRIGCNAQN